MKNFLSIEKFKELKVLFILEILIALLVYMLISVNKFHLNYFDWKAFVISISIWIISCIGDKKKYLNLAALIALVPFFYACFWAMFNISLSH